MATLLIIGALAWVAFAHAHANAVADRDAGLLRRFPEAAKAAPTCFLTELHQHLDEGELDDAARGEFRGSVALVVQDAARFCDPYALRDAAGRGTPGATFASGS